MNDLTQVIEILSAALPNEQRDDVVALARAVVSHRDEVMAESGQRLVALIRLQGLVSDWTTAVGEEVEREESAKAEVGAKLHALMDEGDRIARDR